ncbi:ComEC/Rec2 family competence protein [Pelagibacterium lacus]|uniref:ComEC/Rec2 family competence protein n=1 Tax=Pelagibacterium lacus TaxID=2282655 RepID=A0A369W1R4_9HYPH|nr:ComEC/Rec2 family competence protein [Pelagibacterium lacus]RDE07969.1 ComEC/Rec2 family competence protein [Pelagibacterium lacus]
MVDFPGTRSRGAVRPAGHVVRRGGIRALAATLGTAIADAAAQRRLFILWPFAIILGLIVYRVLPQEPQIGSLAAGGVGLAAAGLWSRRHRWLGMLFQLAVMVWVGLALLPLHGFFLGTNMLQQARYGTYSAHIDAVLSDDGESQRWIISDISGEPDWAVPDVQRARVTVNGGPSVSSGDRMTVRIRFYPVPSPAVPGGYDSQFISYFEGIGAFGTALGDVTVAPRETGALWNGINTLRAAITARLVERLGDRIGGIATALITGDQSRISEGDYDVMAAAGIVHVISISGLHLTLVAGTMFATVRLLLAFGHGLTQRVSIKKIAALCGIVTAFGYMLLSGMVIPAVRSTIMIVLIFAAIIAGRQALTMRNVAIAALIIIAFQPSTIFRASFQMSFAAVVALIAGYEMMRRQREDRAAPPPNRALRMTADVSITSLIAGLATVVFTAFHFQQTAPFGVLGNLMIMPFVSFVLMPSALFGTLLMPLGLEAPLVATLGWSIEAMLWSAEFVRTISGGFDPSPILAPSALVVTLIALGWLAFFRTRLRLAGPILAVPIIALFCLERVPDIMIADQTQAVAVRHGGAMGLIAGRTGTFATNVWSERYMLEIAGRHEATRCDALGCLIVSDQGYTVALVKDRAAFEEDCRVADIVIARIPAPKSCENEAELVVDMWGLRDYGTHMVAWNGPYARPYVQTAIDNPNRPWRPGAQ